MKILIKIFVLIFFFSLSANAKENFFNKAQEYFKKENYEESKFLFQRNIVFNPKDSMSYLYLAKIFKIEENEKEELKNLNTTLLLDPNNEEALYMLIDIELERSNFSEVKELKKKFKIVCSILCDNIVLIDERLKNFDTKEES
tara:strand:+ start:472 stop:900 length:429 start_codon:yes stop_codon:yes gene_type:complete